MEYTILNLSKIAGVSTRTLRYYDGIGILKPARINSSGYRIYGEKEVNQLQQILLYRAMGVNLEMIGDIITSEDFNETAALVEHLTKLLAQRQQIDLLIENVEKTIEDRKGRLKMNDKEKFNGFKKKLIEDNEKEYGKEARAKYGEEVVNESNQKMLNMSEEDYAEYEKLGQEVLSTLEAAFATKDPAGALGQKTAELHRKWLSYTWKSYSSEAHAGLAKMYTADERFKAYYDKDQPGKAEFLRDAILIYTGETKLEN
ncbi:MAG: MerR family transcriptional regulator [Mobilitalea sp.]